MRSQTKYRDELNFTCWAHTVRLKGGGNREKETHWWVCSTENAHSDTCGTECTSTHGGYDVNRSCLPWSRLYIKINKAEFAS